MVWLGGVWCGNGIGMGVAVEGDCNQLTFCALLWEVQRRSSKWVFHSSRVASDAVAYGCKLIVEQVGFVVVAERTQMYQTPKWSCLPIHLLSFYL